MKGHPLRVSPMFFDLVNKRAKNFNNSKSKEQDNIIFMLKDFETRFGFDAAATPVINGKPSFNLKKRVWILK